MAISPHQAAKAEREFRQLARRGVEWGVEQEDRVADGDVFARIAAVGGFDPGNSGGGVRPACAERRRTGRRAGRSCRGWGRLCEDRRRRRLRPRKQWRARRCARRIRGGPAPPPPENSETCFFKALDREV